MRQGADSAPDNLLASSPEAIIHDFFRNHKNHFPPLEAEAERLRNAEQCEADDIYAVLKSRLSQKHGISVRILPIEDMSQALRVYDRETHQVRLSQALDHQNRAFQIAHVLCLVELSHLLDDHTGGSGINSETGLARCQVELANYLPPHS